jgi:hypothetical protein
MKRPLMLVAAVSVIAIVAFAVYFTTLRPPDEGEVFQIVLNPVQPTDLGVDEWLEDFEALYAFVEGNYPFLDVKNRTHGYDWRDLRVMFEDRIRSAETNEDFLRVIMSACYALQNRHTYVINPAVVVSTGVAADAFPMTAIFVSNVTDAAGYWQSPYDRVVDALHGTRYVVSIVYDRGEYVIRDYDAAWEERYGADSIVTHVDGVPVDEAILTLYDREYIDYDFVREKPYVWSIAPRAFGVDAVFTVRNGSDHVDAVSFDVVVGGAGIPYTYPATVVNATRFETERIGYLYVGSFVGERVEAYYDEVMTFYSAIEGYDALIIDIRGNTGGFYSVWIDGIVEPLIHEPIVHTKHFAYRTGDYVTQTQSYLLDEIVAKDAFDYLPPEVRGTGYRIHENYMTYTPDGDIAFTGDIILLTDHVVYSAAEGFANF